MPDIANPMKNQSFKNWHSICLKTGEAQPLRCARDNHLCGQRRPHSDASKGAQRFLPMVAGRFERFFYACKKRAEEGRMMKGFKKTFRGVLAAMTLGLSATSVADDAVGWPEKADLKFGLSLIHI